MSFLDVPGVKPGALDGAVRDKINDTGSATRGALNATILDLGNSNFVRSTPDFAVRLSVLPGLANGTWQWNGVPWSQDNVITSGDVQYAVWVNDAKLPIIGKRTLPNGEWSTFDLSTVGTNEFNTPTAEDGHNNYAMGLDSTGRIHVIGNQHGAGLQYARMNNAGDITSWATPTMVGTEEDLMSYPRFFNGPDGTLYFHYRNGASGNGNNYLNKRNADGTWTRVAFLVDGLSSTTSAYDNRIVIDADGIMHYSFAWKSGSTYNDISDIAYMRSVNGGTTWTTITGTAVTLPVTRGTSPTVLETADNGSGIANQFGMDVDDDGRPHMATFFYDGANRQINHFYWDGAAWINTKVTNFAITINDFTHWPSRPGAIFCHKGRVYIPYRYQYEGKRGALRLLDCTPGRVGFDDFPIMDIDLREWEGSLDGRALRERGELTLLVGAMNADKTSPRPEYWAEDNWSKQWVGILTVDLDRLSELQSRTAKLPTIKPVGRFNIPGATTVTSTGLATLPAPAAGGIITPPELHGKLVFARLSIRGSVSASGTTLTVLMREFQQGNGNPQRNFGTVTFTITTTSIKTTPWIPLVNGPRGSFDAFVDVLASAAGGGTGAISYGHVELGVLDAP